MDDIGDSLRQTILEQNVEMLLANKIQPTALANGLVPVDIDVTPMDNSKSKKEGVSRTYKGFDGYAPMMAYIGTEGYAINFELREGKQHCQKGTVEFLQETIKLCHKLTDKPLLIRLDSGNDSIDNVAVLMDTGCFFIIKRNLRRESTDDWFEMAKQYFQNVNSPRDGKTVYIGMVRVVNVERVLKKAAYRGTGQLILGIKDSVLTQNNGSCWIRFTNGTLTAIERMPQDQVPQITMDIADFAYGIFRGFAEGEISDYDSVEILDQKVIQNGTLGQIFYPKKNFIMEYFKKIFLYGKRIPL